MKKDYRDLCVICFGDSITEGYMVDSSLSYPSILERCIGIKCHNLGVSADTSIDGLKRMGQVDSCLIRVKKAFVLIEFGINDFFSGFSKGHFKENLKKIIEHILSKGHHPVILGFKLDYPGVAKWTLVYEELSDCYQIPLYPNIFHGLSTEAGDFFSDGLHPTQKGYEKLGSKICQFLLKGPLALL